MHEVLVLNSFLLLNLELDLSSLLVSLDRFNFLVFVDSASFLHDTWFILEDIDVNDIILVELLRPSFWDSVLDLILELLNIW